jgi:hypothetical protein
VLNWRKTVSVVIVVKVSEGLVLAADSAATLHGRIEGPQGVGEGILKTFYNAKKLLQIGDFPIGVLTWGQAFIGPRTVESLVREWEYNNCWQSKDQYKKKFGNSFAVKECAEGLRTYLAATHAEAFGHQPTEERPQVGIVVAGYSEGAFFPEIWRFVLPFDSEGEIHNQRPDHDGKPDFGASWFGATDAIIRLHWGRDEAVMKIISEKFGIPNEEVREALEPLQYQIPFPLMPLQDAIEYANYMLNVTIGRYRFVLGPELCGGQIEIAAITPREFNWISQKSWGL